MVFHDSITVRDYEPVIISCVRKVPPSNRFLVRPKLGKKGRLESKNGMANEKGGNNSIYQQKFETQKQKKNGKYHDLKKISRRE